MKLRLNLDSLGMCASTLCMFHCLAFPLLIAALPLVRLSADEPSNNVDDLNSGRSSRGDVLASSPKVGSLQDACATLECCERAAGIGGADGNDNAACCATPGDFWIHVGLLSAMAPLGLIAWGTGYRKHRKRGVLCLGLSGVALLAGALLFGTQLWGGRGEQVMTVLGSVCMVSAHLWNRRQCLCCNSPKLGKLVGLKLAQSKQTPLASGGIS